VFDEQQGDYFTVPCTYPEYANKLTLAQHLLIRRHANQTTAERVDVELYERGKEKLRQLIALANNSKQLSQRKKAARYDTKALQQARFRPTRYRKKSASHPTRTIALTTSQILMSTVRSLMMLDQSKLNQTWASVSRLIIKYPAFNEAIAYLRTLIFLIYRLD